MSETEGVDNLLGRLCLESKTNLRRAYMRRTYNEKATVFFSDVKLRKKAMEKEKLD